MMMCFIACLIQMAQSVPYHLKFGVHVAVSSDKDQWRTSDMCIESELDTAVFTILFSVIEPHYKQVIVFQMMTFILVYPFGTFKQFNYETNINKRDSVLNVCQDVRISRNSTGKPSQRTSTGPRNTNCIFVQCSKSNYRSKVSTIAYFSYILIE